VEIHAAAYNFDFPVNFGMSGRYKQPVQYGRESAHKSRAAWAVFSLGVCMRERQHIYEDLNESSSANPGGSQQQEIPPSPNISGPPGQFINTALSPSFLNDLQTTMAGCLLPPTWHQLHRHYLRSCCWPASFWSARMARSHRCPQPMMDLTKCWNGQHISFS
jgi:hypothetical protein